MINSKKAICTASPFKRAWDGLIKYYTHKTSGLRHIYVGLRTSADKAISICDTAKTVAPDLLRIVSLDPVLSFLVQHLYYKFYPNSNQDYVSFERIIIALHLNTVKNIVLQAAETSYANLTEIGMDQEKFWKHSVATAIFAKLLAKERGVKQENLQEYWTAALIHDIGKFAQAAQGLLVNIDADYSESGHAKAGAEYAKACGLPDSLCAIMSEHHSLKLSKAAYAPIKLDLLYNTIAANYLANKAGFSCKSKKGDKQKTIKKLPPVVLSALNLTQKTGNEIFVKIKIEFDEQFKKIERFILDKSTLEKTTEIMEAR
ncbi:MAG: HDOD domain-containing protein [Termitinemataceae bacterium]|nr:MAG: HDOD domain-containing protein [Termitinemataceae bacterium]